MKTKRIRAMHKLLDDLAELPYKQAKTIQRHHILAADARALLDNAGYGPNTSQIRRIDAILCEIAGITESKKSRK